MKKLLALILILIPLMASAEAVVFTNGSTTTVINYGSGAILDNLTNQTYIVWATLTTLDPASSSRFLILKGGGGVANNLAITSTGTGTFDYSRECGATDCIANALFSSFTGVTTNVPLCLAATRSGVNAPKLYIKVGRSGEVHEPSAYATQTGGSALGDDSANSIQVGGAAGGAFGLPGSVSFAATFSEVLTPSEINSVCLNALDSYLVAGGSKQVLVSFPGRQGGTTVKDFSGMCCLPNGAPAWLRVGAAAAATGWWS